MNRSITVTHVVIGVGVILLIAFLAGSDHILPTGKPEVSKGKPTIQDLLKKRNEHGWMSLSPDERTAVKRAYRDYLTALAVATEHSGKAYSIRGNIKGAQEMAYHNGKLKEAIATINRSSDEDDPCVFQTLLDQVESVMK